MSRRRSTHECRYWQPSGGGRRGRRWCDFCGRRQVKVRRRNEIGWEDERKLEWFAERWLPAISGTSPARLMTVQVAYPFEWNCYESWNIVYRVIFTFPTTDQRLLTRVGIMNGWQSGWAESWNRVDAEAEDYYHERTGRWYDTGDNAYGEMRELIQSFTPPPPGPPSLRALEDE